MPSQLLSERPINNIWIKIEFQLVLFPPQFSHLQFLTNPCVKHPVEDGLIYWEEEKEPVTNNEYGYSAYARGGPSTVEMTSYALLMYIARDDVAKAKPVAMWLTEARSSSGGYYSTQVPYLTMQSRVYLFLKCRQQQDF